MRRILTVLVLLLIAVAVLDRPPSTRGLESRPSPTRSYEQSLARIAELRSQDPAGISPECRTKLMTHGAPTARAIVLFHGLTNCPAQFDSLGRLLFATGANVLIPRLPRHGSSNRMTDSLAKIDARELCSFTDRALDAASGMGDSLIVVGLSISAVMAAWAGQMRADVHRAVGIAPLLGIPAVPAWATPAVMRLTLATPNVFLWWDPKRREQLLGPRHVYPRFSTRSIGASLLLGAATLEQARRAPPACREIVIVTVGGDAAVNNGVAAELVRAWNRRGARRVTTFEFPEELHLNHDVIDPEQVGANPEVTYPRLLRLIAP